MILVFFGYVYKFYVGQNLPLLLDCWCWLDWSNRKKDLFGGLLDKNML